MTTFEEYAAELAADLPTESPEVASTPVGESVSEQAEVETGEPTQTPQSFDLDAYADQVVTVKVNGEDMQVPVAELRNGYMRQADYTRKTQETAEAARLYQALQADPAGTIELLNRFYTPQQVQDMVAEAEDADPEVSSLRTEVQQLRQFQADLQMERTMERMRSVYPDFDPVAVANEALRRGTSDVETVYKLMVADRALAQQAARQQVAAQQAAGDQQALAAKTQLAETVTAGGSAAGAGSAPTQFADLDAAIAAALESIR